MPDSIGGHESKAEAEEWEAKKDVRTLVEAGEIKEDKARMKRATAMAEKQMKSLKAVKA